MCFSGFALYYRHARQGVGCDEWGDKSIRSLIIFLMVMCLPVLPAAAAVSKNFGTYHAIVIGNNNYEDLSNLKSAAKDAQAVAQLLKNEHGFNVRLLIDAKREDVIGALAQIRAKLTANDNLLIYYAGHGVLDEYAEEGYWLPVDAKKDDPSNWISNGDITNMMRAIRARHVMVISDSCFSGTLVRAADAKLVTAEARNTWIARMNAKRSRTALVSGGLEPVIDSGGGSDHSVFAKAFMDTLRANPDVLDGQTLFSKVGRPVALESDQTPQYSDIRRAGHDGGDFLFVRAAATKVASAVAPKDGTARNRGLSVRKKAAAPTTSAPATDPAVELAFWDSIKNSTDAAEFEAYISEYPTGAFVSLAARRIKKLKTTTIAALTPAPTPTPAKRTVILTSDHNGSYVGEVLVIECEGFEGTSIEVEVEDGKVSGYGFGSLQLNGEVVSPTKIRGDAWNTDGVVTYTMKYEDEKWVGTWQGGSDSSCRGTIHVARK